MPAKSKAQQRLMGMVHAAQQGEKPASPKVAKLAKSMTKKSATDFASTKHKGLPNKKKKPKYENNIGEIHAVLHPHEGCSVGGMIKEIDPLKGLAPHSVMAEEVHSLHPSREHAIKTAKKLHGEHLKKLEEIEKKKDHVAKKITQTIDALEKKRKGHVDLAKEDPKNARAHKEHIAHLAHQIDDLMDKLEKVERSKKHKKEDKKK